MVRADLWAQYLQLTHMKYIMSRNKSPNMQREQLRWKNAYGKLGECLSWTVRYQSQSASLGERRRNTCTRVYQCSGRHKLLGKDFQKDVLSFYFFYWIQSLWKTLCWKPLGVKCCLKRILVLHLRKDPVGNRPKFSFQVLHYLRQYS